MSFILLLGFFMVFNTNAQSKKISMQGFLKDANGKAVADGNKVLTFKIYDAQTGGTALWTNVFSTVPVVGGVYAVQLGTGKNAANIDTEISSLPWNVPYYVGITVESETELTPRTEFTYAPYTFAVNKSNLADVATRALTADAVGGGVNLAVNDSDANIRTIKNSTSPIDRNIYIGKGSGSLSSLYLYSNNDTTMTIAGGNVITKANAKIGIGGVTSPAAALDVRKNNTTDPTAQFRGTTYNSTFNSGTTEDTYITGGKSSSKVLINSVNGGNVGIGTSSPTTAKLVINAGGTEGQGLDLSSSNSVANLRIIQNSNFGTDKDLYVGYGSGANSAVHLYSNNAETMTVKGGYVGIGVTAPAATLDVAKSPNITTAFFRGTSYHSFFNFGSSEETIINGGKPGAVVYINYNNDGGNIIMGNTTSNVGIAITNPLAPLHVGTKTGTTTAQGRRFFGVSDGGLQYDTAPTTNISVRAEGNFLCNGAYIALSDKRIKNILGITNTATDLSILNKIEVTDYKYKDEITNGSGLQKKVIAQQLQEVYPQAIVSNKGIIPNVFALAKETKVLTQSTIIITTKAHEFATGDRVKLILEKTGDKELIVTVIDANTFSVAEVINDKIFVYGKHVNDLLTVDYDAISMLNVSATQELSKQIEQLKAENAKLQNRLMKIEASLQNGLNAGTGK
jgi:hypothetical protein